MSNKEKAKQEKKQKRKKKIRAKITGAKSRPRLSVFKSNREVFLQLINDDEGKTLVSVHSKEIKGTAKKTDKCFEAGKLLAKKAKEKKIEKIVFDRGGNKYHSRIKAVADGAREGGLIF